MRRLNLHHALDGAFEEGDGRQKWRGVYVVDGEKEREEERETERD